MTLSLSHFFSIISQRLPILCCAFLCSGALALCIGSITTCQFFRINYNNNAGNLNDHSPFENFDNVSSYSTSYRDAFTTASSKAATQTSTYSNTHDLGLFCPSSIYSEDAPSDLIWQLSRGFTFASLVLLSFTSIASWSCTIIRNQPSAYSWKMLSIIALLSAGIETPIFLFFSVKPCVTDGQKCVPSKGFFMLVWSVVLLVACAILTQVFDYPDYLNGLEEWKVKKSSSDYVEDYEDVDEEHGAVDFDDENGRRRRVRRIRGDQRHFMSLMESNIDLEHGVDEKIMNNSYNHDQQQQLQQQQQQQQPQHQEKHDVIEQDNNILETNESNDQPQSLQSDDIITTTKRLLYGYFNSYLKHSLLREDSNYDGEYNENEYKNDSTTSNLEMKLTHRQEEETTLMKMKYLDTKSDSSRLLIRIGDKGNKIDHDGASIRSFELNLDDHSIVSLDNHSSEQLTTPRLSSHGSNSSQNIHDDEIVYPYADNDSGVIISPAQFSPARRAAANSESFEIYQSVNGADTFPTQQLRLRDEHDKNTEYQSQKSSERDHSNDLMNMHELYLGNPEHSSRGMDKQDTESIQLQTLYLGNETIDTYAQGNVEKVITIDNMSLLEAIVAGTNAAEDANNYKELDPEPVYYSSSSSESETSSISTGTKETAENNYMLFYDCNDQDPEELFETYSEGDLKQTSKYLQKKLKRLQRKAEKRKEKDSKRRKSPKSGSKSVCSKISLTELTIDEETDMDLELEEYSGDDNNKGFHALNLVSPLSAYGPQSVKSSPAKILTSLTKKPKAFFYADVDSSGEDNESYKHEQTKIQYCVSKELPIVSPISDNEEHYYSAGESSSLSTGARNARINRIRMEMKRYRLGSPKKNLSEILRANDSLDVSYGSDEASC